MHRQTSRNAIISIKYFKRLISLVWSLHPVLVTWWIVLILIPASFPVVQIWLQKESVNTLMELEKGAEQLIPVMLIVSSLYAFNVFGVIFQQFQNYVYILLKEDTGFFLKKAIAEKSIRLPYTVFEDSAVYDSLQLAITALGKNVLDALRGFFQIISIGLSLSGVIALLTVAHWTLPIALIMSALPGILLLLYVKKRKFRLTVDTTPAGREMNYTFKLLFSRDSAKEIRIFQLGGYLLERWQVLYKQVTGLVLKQSVREGVSESVGVLLLSLASASVALILVWQVGAGKVTVGDYVALTGAVLSLQAMLGSLGKNIGDIFETALHIQNLYSFLDREGQEYASTVVDFPDFAEMKVNNLSFCYPGQDKKTLDGITFTVRKGEKIAIVGENGAGKSSLVKCLMGLYPVPEGVIYLDEIDYSRIYPESIWANITVVFQDFIKYQYTIRENVGFGQVEQMDQDEVIVTALKNAGVENLVQKFTNGLDTLLGKEFLGGQELSGGQWQRVAIARAFMRNADIFVFDEPTSALDPQAELEIFKCFSELSKHKTAIMISHRLGPARLADRILVLRDGKLVEQGNHQQLMELDGEYSRMFNAQAEWYQVQGIESQLQLQEG